MDIPCHLLPMTNQRLSVHHIIEINIKDVFKLFVKGKFNPLIAKNDSLSMLFHFVSNTVFCKIPLCSMSRVGIVNV